MSMLLEGQSALGSWLVNVYYIHFVRRRNKHWKFDGIKTASSMHAEKSKSSDVRLEQGDAKRRNSVSLT